MKLALLTVPVLIALGLSPAHLEAQQISASQRKAAAEAYDRGTANYLAGDYGRAAEWFATAHRMAPAAPALMQAIRAHLKAENLAEAGTLALRLEQEYAEVEQAVSYARTTLEELSPQLFRLDVLCDDCRIDLDGKIVESTSFLLEPGSDHSVTASFDTGDVTEQVSGHAGESQQLTLDAPAAAVEPGADGEILIGPAIDQGSDRLPPLYTYIAAGVTGALLVGTLGSYLSLSGKNSDFEDATKAYNEEVTRCGNCQEALDLYDDATDKRDAALGAQTLTNVLLVVTPIAAIGTGVLGVFFTDWDGDDGADDGAELTFRVERIQDGPFVSLGGRF